MTNRQIKLKYREIKDKLSLEIIDIQEKEFASKNNRDIIAYYILRTKLNSYMATLKNYEKTFRTKEDIDKIEKDIDLILDVSSKVKQKITEKEFDK